MVPRRLGRNQNRPEIRALARQANSAGLLRYMPLTLQFWKPRVGGGQQNEVVRQTGAADFGIGGG